MAQFVGAARTIGKWPLVTAGRYNTPYVLDCKDTGKVRQIFTRRQINVTEFIIVVNAYVWITHTDLF